MSIPGTPPGSGDKAMLLVSHTTHLEYGEPVVEAHSEVRKTPVDTSLQRVVTHQLEVAPTPKLGSYVDYFGNRVHHFNLLEPHMDLTIRSEVVVETTDAACCGVVESSDRREWRQRLAEFLHWSPAVPPLEEYAGIDHPLRPECSAQELLDGLGELGRSFQQRFRYDLEATDVHSSPKVLFEAGGGVCQDFAHAMLGVLRLAGLPARYVSGYVYDPGTRESALEADMVIGAGASHAWVEVWHPELGWVGVDPTNDRLIGWQYVRVAVGRDYGDVQPLRGIYVGAHDQELAVEVKLERIG